MQIGITEAGDPALDKSWVNRLKEGNIIITKNPGAIQEELLQNAGNLVLHATVTGHGGTTMEPNVPAPETVIEDVVRLIDAGFPASQIVLRVDPIIPEMPDQAYHAISLGSELSKKGVTRARYSFIDMYPHVKTRFQEAGYEQLVKAYQGRFTVDSATAKMLAGEIEQRLFRAGFRTAESCGEYAGRKVGCVSEADVCLLNLNTDDIRHTVHAQRKSCNCISNKTELLNSKKQCGHGCLYCYWK